MDLNEKFSIRSRGRPRKVPGRDTRTKSVDSIKKPIRRQKNRASEQFREPRGNIQRIDKSANKYKRESPVFNLKANEKNGSPEESSSRSSSRCLRSKSLDYQCLLSSERFRDNGHGSKENESSGSNRSKSVELNRNLEKSSRGRPCKKKRLSRGGGRPEVKFENASRSTQYRRANETLSSTTLEQLKLAVHVGMFNISLINF